MSSSDSTSNANQTSTTEQFDMRVAGGANSSNVSAQNSSVTITDLNAVEKAFSYSQATALQSFGFAKSSLAGTLELANESLTVAEHSQSMLADAYKTAKAGEQKIMVAGALLIGGIVAVQALKR